MVWCHDKAPHDLVFDPTGYFYHQAQDNSLEISNMVIWKKSVSEALKLICAVFPEAAGSFKPNICHSVSVKGYKISLHLSSDRKMLSSFLSQSFKQPDRSKAHTHTSDERLLISRSLQQDRHFEQLQMHTPSNHKFSIQFPSNRVSSKAELCLNMWVWRNEGMRGRGWIDARRRGSDCSSTQDTETITVTSDPFMKIKTETDI